MQKMKALLTPEQREELESILDRGPRTQGKDRESEHEKQGQPGDHEGK